MVAEKKTKKQDTVALIHGIKPYKEKKKEEYMSDAQLAHFSAILKNWLKEVTDDTTRTVNTIQDDTDNHPDPADRASLETDLTLELRGRDRDRKLIKKIERSIEELSTGDFGFCEKCGEDIGLRRLEARPTATLCIDCKTLDEIRERQLS